MASTILLNTQVLFKSEPKGFVAPTDMEVVNVPFNLNDVELGEKGVVLKTLYFSLDPYLRGRMAVGRASYVASFTLGQPMSSGGVGEVVKSANPDYPVGTVVLGSLTWESYVTVQDPAKVQLRKIDTSLGVPLSYYLGILGMPGLTAYAGLLKIGQPKKGETLYVSAASGAVGMVVCQIGKILGLRVVGSAGSDDKVDFLREVVKVDAAFNYQTVEDIGKALDETCPNGIDIYFENVGGEMLDAVLVRMNNFGRIPVCGMISQYNGAGYGIKNAMSIIGKRLLLQGFIVSDYAAEMTADFVKDVGGWIKSGELQYKEDVSEGLASIPEALVGLFKGSNFGKAIIKV
ncbi:hypothetical protein HDU76_010810 [Blyttiomyces sp. JEL0837]|nr:hypothetical protein HDU76_010810 [Blyttiomyces sp. JEL0837]